MTSVVGEKGQVTIPQELRKRLGIHPRTVLEFSEEGGCLVAVKVCGRNPVDKAVGCLRLNRRVDDVIRELTGDE